MVSTRALQCFLGGWSFINTTQVNTTTNLPIQEWHSPHPSGIVTYTPSGHHTFIITANDTTEPEKRPADLQLPASPTDSDARWALVGKYSLAAGGLFYLRNVSDAVLSPPTTDGNGNGTTYGNETGDAGGPSGELVTNLTTATLPSWVGLTLVGEFAFYEDCGVHVLVSVFGDVRQTVWFGRLPGHDVFV